MLRSIIIATVLSLATPALANEAVDRFEAASETISEKLYQLSNTENPGVFKSLPDHTWDDAHRQAGTCILASIADQAGAPAMTRYIVSLERAAARRHTSTASLLEALSFEVPGLSAQAIQLISQGCGLTDLQAARLQAALS